MNCLTLIITALSSLCVSSDVLQEIKDNCSDDPQPFTHRALNTDNIQPLGPPIPVNAVNECMTMCCEIEICNAFQIGNVDTSERSGETRMPCVMFACPTVDQCKEDLVHDKQNLVVILGDRAGSDGGFNDYTASKDNKSDDDEESKTLATTTMSSDSYVETTTNGTLMETDNTTVTTNNTSVMFSEVVNSEDNVTETVVDDTNSTAPAETDFDLALNSTDLSGVTTTIASSEDVSTTTDEPTTTTRHHRHHSHTTTGTSISVRDSNSTDEVDSDNNVVVNVNMPDKGMAVDGWTSESAHAFQRVMLLMTFVGILSCFVVMALFAWVLRRDPKRHDYIPIDEIHEHQLR